MNDELPFRDYHILQILDGYENQGLPLDLFISHYFRANKSLGSKDRGAIAEVIYSMIRWQGLIDFLTEKPINWEKRFKTYTEVSFKDHQDNEEIPLHVRLSFPKVLFDLMLNSCGEEQTKELCRVSNQAAPTTIRANAIKTSRDELMLRFKELYKVGNCRQAENGIVFLKKINLFGTPEFKAGLFEVQDEGSQLLAALVEAKPGMQIMDYCAGSGGKTLAFAPAMQNKGQIFLHDIRARALAEAKIRLRRAGIQNAQVVEAHDEKRLKKLKKKMDVVLVDAPCSGTGTMRRNPDMKWSFSEETVPRLCGQQRTIFEKALSFMHPKGKIIFATCSILNYENQDQMNHFMNTYGLKLVQEPFQTFPTDGGMDGFFAAVFEYA
jgi:16S rRNA C967 or C1407 C5-methylase (RsmB/RsmF family)